MGEGGWREWYLDKGIKVLNYLLFCALGHNSQLIFLYFGGGFVFLAVWSVSCESLWEENKTWAEWWKGCRVDCVFSKSIDISCKQFNRKLFRFYSELLVNHWSSLCQWCVECFKFLHHGSSLNWCLWFSIQLFVQHQGSSQNVRCSTVILVCFCI